MEFGRVEAAQLDAIDFSLPPEPAFNAGILPGRKASSFKIYIGCAKWGRPEWVGKIYPFQTKEKDFLKHYVAHFNAIELNATHYKIIGESGIKKWAEKAAGRDFKFCPKLYKGITHSGNLKNKQFLTNEFFRGVRGFGPYLGPVFIQLSETFSPKRMEELKNFFATLPGDLSYFLELRHPQWFVNPGTAETLFTFLREEKIGAVITDAAGRRDCAHMHLTVPRVFIRYVGNSLHPSDYTRINNWVHRIKTWMERGIEEVYFFMHMHEEATSPELTVYLVDQLQAVCGLSLLKPTFLDVRPGLFPPAAG